ncbi:MAG: excinuclease ABC subunit A [Roseovarius sp.]
MSRSLVLALMGLILVAAVPAQSQPRGCPPGLAKKANGCQPPGLAKKQGIYHRGDRIDGDYVILRNPGGYGLDPDEAYYRVGDRVYRVDRDTRKVLDLIGAAAAILN